MEIYLSLIIPLIFTIVALVLYFLGKFDIPGKNDVLILLAPFTFILLIVMGIKFTSTSIATQDTEYLNYYVTEIRYYEPWDEWITKTCTRTCCCDSKGNNCSTETYDCSYRDYHPEKFTVILNNGDELNVSEELYNKYLKLFNNKTFVDMNRDYYTEDGDMYSSIWNGLNESFLLYTKTSSYTNKVQASHDVFNYPDIDELTAKELGLFDYPEISKFNTNTIISDSGLLIPHSTQISYNMINGMLGIKKQLRLWIIVTKDKPLSWASDQEAYWKGGNKNEFNILISVDKNNKIKWCKCITWCEEQSLKRIVSNYFVKGETLDLNSKSEPIRNLLESKFKRKEFKDFDYLQVDVPLWADITAIIISIILTIASYIILRKITH